MRLVHRLMALIAVLALALALGLGVAACGGDEEEEPADGETTAAEQQDFKVGITQIVSHPALDACVSGFQEVMADEGFVEGENVTYDLQNAQGDMATATSIADKFAADEMDLVFSVATPTSQAMVKASDTIPIVFCAVTDPVGSGLVEDAEKPGANVTGVSDMQPIEPILELVELMPDAEAVGMIYNAGESNSVFLAEQAKADAEAAGYEFVDATAGTTAEVQAAAESLVGRVQAVMVVGDNTAVSALEAIVKVCQENGILLLAGDIDSVERGAAAGFGFDYEDLGRQAGAQAAKILSGTPVADVPVEFAGNLILAVNPESAEKMGVTLPQELLDEAQETY